MISISTPLVIASFGSISMLLWSSVAVIPLVLHLWNRRRYQEVSWAAMEFLMAAVRQDSRRIRLEQWILLLLRMAIPIALAVALADPMLTSSTAGTGRVTSRHVVLVIDGSYSMNARTTDATCFETAKQFAREIVHSLSQGDAVSLLLMSSPPQSIIGVPAFDQQQVVAEIDSLRQRHTAARLLETLDAVQNLLRSSRKSHPRLQEQQVYFITDLGKNTWQAVAEEQVRTRLAQLAETAKLVVQDVSQRPEANLAVTNLHADYPIATVETNVELDATLENLSGKKMDDLQVDFLVDGRLVQRQSVNVAANEQASVRTSYRFETVGEHVVEVRTGPDAMEVDNRRYLSVPVTQAVRILCVYGKPKSADHIALALQPDGSQPGGLALRIVADDQLDEIDLLQDFDCVFLSNTRRFSQEQTRRLREFVTAGRGVIAFLGDQTALDNYRPTIGENSRETSIWPARLNSISPAGEYSFDPLDYRHPIVSPFRGFERAGLLSTPVWRYVQTTPTPNASTSVALAFTNGDPAIIDQQMGLGHFLMVTTAGSSQSMINTDGKSQPWTAFSVWPSFPPLVQEMLRYAIAGRYEHRNLQVGQPIVVRDEVPASSLTIALQTDFQNTIWQERIRTATVGGQVNWSFERTFESGVYRATYEPDLSGPLQFAVNVEAGQESELTRVDDASLPKSLNVQTTLDQAEPASELRLRKSPLFRLALLLVAALLLVEPFVARFLGATRG